MHVTMRFAIPFYVKTFSLQLSVREDESVMIPFFVEGVGES